jgi:hypothetical protein
VAKPKKNRGILPKIVSCNMQPCSVSKKHSREKEKNSLQLLGHLSWFHASLKLFFSSSCLEIPVSRQKRKIQLFDALLCGSEMRARVQKMSAKRHNSRELSNPV